MNERERYQQRYDELSKLMEQGTTKLDIDRERNLYIRELLLQADIICCTLSGAGSECMLKTFMNIPKRDQEKR